MSPYQSFFAARRYCRPGQLHNATGRRASVAERIFALRLARGKYPSLRMIVVINHKPRPVSPRVAACTGVSPKRTTPRGKSAATNPGTAAGMLRNRGGADCRSFPLNHPPRERSGQDATEMACHAPSPLGKGQSPRFVLRRMSRKTYSRQACENGSSRPSQSLDAGLRRR